MTKTSLKLKSGANDNSSSVIKKVLRRSECTSFKKAKKRLTNLLYELEPFGLYVSNHIKQDYPYLLPARIIQPKHIKEFGTDITTFGLGEIFIKMVETLIFQALRIRILKESTHFLNESFLIRAWTSKNSYPTYYYAEKIKSFGSDQEIEIVFFATSKRGAEQIKKRLQFTMEKGKTLQFYVDDIFKIKFNDSVEKLVHDSQIQRILELYSLMTESYVQKKLQDEKGK